MTGRDQSGDALGLYNYKARFYSTVTGRFVSANIAADGLNRYSYVHDNPLRFNDPTGYDTASDWEELAKLAQRAHEWGGEDPSEFIARLTTFARFRDLLETGMIQVESHALDEHNLPGIVRRYGDGLSLKEFLARVFTKGEAYTDVVGTQNAKFPDSHYVNFYLRVSDGTYVRVTADIGDPQSPTGWRVISSQAGVDESDIAGMEQEGRLEHLGLLRPPKIDDSYYEDHSGGSPPGSPPGDTCACSPGGGGIPVLPPGPPVGAPQPVPAPVAPQPLPLVPVPG